MTDLPIARNTGLLSAALAANSGMLQLQAAVASLTLVQVLGIHGLLGLGPAIVLASGALTAPVAGRAMDRVGRVPVLAGGFAIGAAGGVLAAIGCAAEVPVLVLAGFVFVGMASGTALLARTAAGDMYPPENRAHGIALVLFGAVFGAILGPAVFSPLLAGRDLDGDALAPLWLAGSGFMLVALVLVLLVRPDPKRIAELLHTGDPPPATEVPLGQIIARPGVIPALLAAQASFGVMVGVMTLTGAVVVMALSVISLLWIDSVVATAAALFGLGLGWNFSFVAATAELADSTLPSERGRLIGFNDLLSGLTGAGLALLGGVALESLGVAALALGAAALVSGPALWLARHRPVPAT